MGVTHGFVHAFDITPSDTANLPEPAECVYVGGAGNVTLWTAGNDQVTLTAVPVGTLIPIKVRRVTATGTTATLMRGFWGA